MWSSFPSIGLVELALVAAVALAVGITWACRRSDLGWLLGVPVCLLIAAVVTPPDPATMLIVAAPYTIGYLFLVRSRRKLARERT